MVSHTAAEGVLDRLAPELSAQLIAQAMGLPVEQVEQRLQHLPSTVIEECTIAAAKLVDVFEDDIRLDDDAAVPLPQDPAMFHVSSRRPPYRVRRQRVLDELRLLEELAGYKPLNIDSIRPRKDIWTMRQRISMLIDKLGWTCPDIREALAVSSTKEHL